MTCARLPAFQGGLWSAPRPQCMCESTSRVADRHCQLQVMVSQPDYYRTAFAEPFPACLQRLVSRPTEDDYARINRLNAERDAIAARKARQEEAKRVSCSVEICWIGGARHGCYHRTACRTVLFGQQAEIAHQLCREVAVAVAKHAACICLAWCTPARNSRAFLPCRRLQHLPSMSGLVPQSAVQHASYDCTVLPVIGTPAVQQVGWVSCRAACNIPSFQCWILHVQEAEAVHRRRHEEAAAAARHAAVEEAAKRRAEQERLRHSFAEVGIASNCHALALHCMLALSGSLCCLRTSMATRMHGFQMAQSFTCIWGPLARSKATVLQGRPACECPTCETVCCRRRSASSKRRYCRPSGGRRCSKCWKSRGERSRQLWRPRGARDGRKARRPSASG